MQIPLTGKGGKVIHTTYLGIIILIAAIVILTKCNHTANFTKPVNPAAKKLNDSAMEHYSHVGDSNRFDIVMKLLDSSTKIDDQYYLAYWNKLIVLGDFGRYNEAINVTRELQRLRPLSPDIYSIRGTLYYKIGNMDSVHNNYKTADDRYNDILDTMSKSNRDYKALLLNKAINLKLMGEQTKGESILKDLYEQETVKEYKELISSYMNKSKEEMLDEISFPK